eukprot:2932812-Amphidinium_carterae.1
MSVSMGSRQQLPLLSERAETEALARESWRQAFLSGEAAQLRAAERLLRNVWVVPLSVLGGHLNITDWEPTHEFTEVALVALCWEGGVETAMSNFVMVVPEAALPEDFIDGSADALVSVGLYTASGEAIGACS